MGRACPVTPLVFALIFNLVAQTVYLSFVVGCHDVERQALSKFKQSFRDPHNRFSSWKGMNCCGWDGVSCNNVTFYVNRLDLRSLGSWPLTAQKLDSSLIVLKQLNHLDLSGNEFQKSQIPTFIGSFTHLRYLDLSYSNFRGIFPPQHRNFTRFKLRQLNHLDLSNNDFQGSQIPGFIGSFKNLRHLDLSNANFSAVFPLQLDNELKQLNHLDLSFNDFQGSPIPGFIGSFKHLTYLDLSNANFSAIFPIQLGNLTRLQHLGLSGPKGGYLQWNPALVNSQHLDTNDVLISNTKNIVQVLSRLSSLNYLQLNLCGLTSNPHLYSLLSNSTWSSRLEFLHLSNNLLAGPLPYILANRSSLVELGLSNNFFNGSIPLWFRNFRELEALDLSYNSFSAIEEGVIMRILETLLKLRYLDFSFNSLEGQLADTCGNFSKAVIPGLEVLDLGNNKITGSLPIWLGEFEKMTWLDIDSNRISGYIPVSIGNLSLLKLLILSNNSLDGLIPESLGQLNKLNTIDLSRNHLAGVVSSSHFANLSSLVSLNLSKNPIKLTFSNDWIPPFQLELLDLSCCRIGAELPGWITSQTSLEQLFLSNTDISGEVPDFLCQLSQLSIIDLQSNKLFGTIPDCWRSKSLNLINLSSNNLSGPIPESIGRLTGLIILNLNSNSLEGRIPPTIGSLSNLMFMDIGENKLSGGLPLLRPNSLPYLKILRLRSNKLVGLIPEYLCSLLSIRLLDLANNNFTGIIPHCFCNFTNMEYDTNIPLEPLIYITTNEEVKEVLKGEELKYTSNLKFVKNLDLSCNLLVGSIPEVITKLSGLIGFNLSHNQLIGSIPETIGRMRSLESLDLSNNHLSGTIPSSLAALTSLSSLNLSNNQLTGQIPTGNQLQVLNNPSTYGGNPGLCGDPLPRKCKTNPIQQLQQPERERNKEGGREKALFYFVIFSGFASGFWGVVGSLLLNRRFRFALFQLVSNIADYLYVQVMVNINRLRNYHVDNTLYISKN